MDKRSFFAGASASAVVLIAAWLVTGGRYLVATPERDMPLRVDRLTGETYVLQRDEDANGSQVGPARWYRIPDATAPSPLQ